MAEARAAEDVSRSLSRRRRVRWLAALLVLVAIIVTGWFARASLLSSIGRWLDDSATTFERADVGYILGGGRSSRPDYAATLFHGGKLDRFVLPRSSGLADVDGVVLLGEQAIVDGMLQALDVPEQSIEKLQSISDSTEDEARTLLEYLEAHPHVTVAVITNDYHTRRSRLVFERVLGERFSQVTVLGCPSGHGGPDRWWHTPDGFSAYALEILKLGAEMSRFGQ